MLVTKRRPKTFRRSLAAKPDWLRQNLLILAATMLAVLFLSIGYALLNTNLSIGGSSSIQTAQPVRITNVEASSPQPSCGLPTYPPTWTRTNFQVDGNLPALNCSLVFNITVKNETSDIIYIKEITEESFSNSNHMEYHFSLTPNSPDAVIPVQGDKHFTLTMQYKPGQAALPALTSFAARFQLVFDIVTPPILNASTASRNFEIFRGETAFTPANLDGRMSALDDIDGDITSQINKTCQKSGSSATCPATWQSWDSGNYTITYQVSNSLGLSAAPITMNIELWKFTKIASGQYHGMALGSNGSVWTWGYNNFGQRGMGVSGVAVTINGGAPTHIPQTSFGGQRAIDIAAGQGTSCALMANGQAYCWGNDNDGSLGNGGSNTNSNVPLLVTMPSGITFTQISGAHGTTVNPSFGALGSDGNVYTWGNGANFRLGTGSTNNSTVPTKITTTGDIIQVSQGNMGGAAINSAGQVYVWGANGQGQLARGNSTASNATTSRPSLVNNLSNIKQVSYGGYGGSGFVLALRTDGIAFGWGWAWGVRGNSPMADVTTPLQIANITGVRLLTAGPDYSHFTIGNEVWGLGYSNYGETFTGTTSRTTPTRSTFPNVTGNVGMTSGAIDNAYLLNSAGTMVYGVGYNNANDRELGSTATAAVSNNAVVPWTPTITVSEW